MDTYTNADGAGYALFGLSPDISLVDNLRQQLIDLQRNCQFMDISRQQSRAMLTLVIEASAQSQQQLLIFLFYLRGIDSAYLHCNRYLISNAAANAPLIFRAIASCLNSTPEVLVQAITRRPQTHHPDNPFVLTASSSSKAG